MVADRYSGNSARCRSRIILCARRAAATIKKGRKGLWRDTGIDVWKQYARDLFESAGKIRVFCDPVLVDPIEASLEWQEGIEQLVNALTTVSAA